MISDIDQQALFIAREVTSNTSDPFLCAFDAARLALEQSRVVTDAMVRRGSRKLADLTMDGTVDVEVAMRAALEAALEVKS